MNQHHKLLTRSLWATFAIGLFPAMAAEPQQTPVAPLNQAGAKLEAEYAAMLKSLKEEITGALPQVDESQPADSLKPDLEQLLTSDKLDAKLVKFALITQATPGVLASLAQQGAEQKSLVDKLLADPELMKQMVVAGGPSGGRYDRAIQIYADIQQAGTHAREGILQRFALGTSLEHAVPMGQRNPLDQPNAPTTVDPVKRYQHYEKACLDGELDSGFKELTVWDYRLVVNGAEPDWALAWGREMLRNYRPDHIYTPDARWRYAAAVRTEVKYGSQNVKDDLPSQHSYQNIPKNGGVCGRRAFFGRFILRSFGIPVWGVTQHKHAALSHWTPKGWVVNLGAGFQASWWDKDGGPRSGSDFLLETQAREDAAGYLKVLRAQWVSRALGEDAYNDRRKVAGGLWSDMAHNQAVVLAARAVELGPLGQELGEANESPEQRIKAQVPVHALNEKVVVNPDGSIVIPAAAYRKPSGPCAAMKSFSGGMQIHCGGGFKAVYAFEAPQAGVYRLTARVATLQEGQKFLVAANDARQPVGIAVPYTVGLWQQTQPVQISVARGANTLRVELQQGSRGVTVKNFTMAPVK